jgi:hypothetical protein
MCFIHDDYDWIAQVMDEGDAPAEKDLRCAECHAAIPAGTVRHWVYLQQHEECDRCFGDRDEDCPCPAPKDRWGGCEECKCEEPDFGEHFDYDRCTNCERFLRAVQEAEEEAGCRSSEARPGLGTMIEDINNGDRDDAKRYWKKARELFPELVASGYLGRLWRRCFG